MMKMAAKIPCRCGARFMSSWGLEMHMRKYIRPTCGKVEEQNSSIGKKRRLSTYFESTSEPPHELKSARTISDGVLSGEGSSSRSPNPQSQDTEPHTQSPEGISCEKSKNDTAEGEGDVNGYDHAESDLEEVEMDSLEITDRPSKVYPITEEGLVDEAEKILSADDASLEEMIDAFKQLVDIVGNKAGLGLTNRILRLILHPNWTRFDVAAELRAANLETVEQIRADLGRKLEKSFKAEGFEEKIILNPDNPTEEYTTVWARDPLVLFQNQLNQAVLHGEDLNFHATPFHEKNSLGEPAVGHPLSARLAHLGTAAVKREVVATDGITWTEGGDTDRHQSMCLLGQLYSDSSSTTLSTNSLPFYPLQLTCLNFTTAFKEKIVASGDAVIAYLSTDKTWKRRVDVDLEVQRGWDGDDLLSSKALHPTVAKTVHDRMRASDFAGLSDPSENIRTDYSLLENLVARKSHVGEEPESDDDKHSLDEAESSEDEIETPKLAAFLQRTQAEAVTSQRIFAACFHTCVEKVRREAAAGILFVDRHGKKWKGHLAIASYVADSPEINHVGCVMKYHCHKCYCPKKELSGASGTAATSESRDPRRTKSLLRAYQQARVEGNVKKRNDVLAQLRSDKVHPMYPVLFDWPFSSIPGFRSYEIFRFDHMHSHPLGILKHLLFALYRFATTDALSTNNRTFLAKDRIAFVCKKNPKTSMHLRKSVILGAINALLTSIDRDSPTSNFRVDFTRTKLAGKLNALFTEKGIVSMLEAKHFKNVTEVLPFIGALADRLGQPLESDPEPGKAPHVKSSFTRLFAAYVDADQAYTRRGRVDKSYTQDQVEDICRKKRNFASLAVHPDVDFLQKSRWNLEKFHKSTFHAVNDVIDLGFYGNYDSAIYESSHIVFKKNHSSTSRRICVAMTETVQKITRQALARHTSIQGAMVSNRHALVRHMVTGNCVNPQIRLTTTSARQDAIVKDETVLSQTGRPFKLATLQILLQNVEAGENNWNSFLSKAGAAKLSTTSSSSIDTYAANEFVRLCGGPNYLAKPILDVILDRMVSGYDGEDVGIEKDVRDRRFSSRGYGPQHISVRPVTSGYVPSLNVPTIGDVHCSESGENFLRVKDQGERHVIRAIASNNFSHAEQRRQDNVLVRGSPSELDEAESIYVAKVLSFVRITAPVGYFANKKNQEQAVVRYYEVLPLQDYDDVDHDLACVKLRWAVSAEDDAWVDVVPVRTICAVVQVVPDGLHVLSEPESEAKEEGANSWRNRRFYVNRFRTYPYDVAYRLDKDGNIV